MKNNLHAKELYVLSRLYAGDPSRLANRHYENLYKNHFATHLRISNTMRQLSGAIIETAGDGPLEVSVSTVPAGAGMVFERRSDIATVFSEKGVLFQITSGEFLFCCSSLFYNKNIAEVYDKIAEKPDYAASFPIDNGVYVSLIEGYLRRSDESEDISTQMMPTDARQRIAKLAGQRAFKQISEEAYQAGVAALQIAKLYAVKGVRVFLQPIESAPMDYDPDSSELSLSMDRAEKDNALYALLGIDS